ncbi:MAG: hypothetical protein IPF92_26125 [Myxococcales bacterium]|nr:hypothetical protein [Myxococcales bacterium]
MRAFFSLGALAALLLAGCGGGVSSVRFTDFEAGKSVAGMPIAGTDLATLKQQAAALPAEVFVDRAGASPSPGKASGGSPKAGRGTRGVRKRLSPVERTEDINGTRDTARASYVGMAEAVQVASGPNGATEAA